MKLLDRLKDALFEDEDEEEVARQVDVEKTIKKDDKKIRTRTKEHYEEFDEKDADFIKPFELDEDITTNEPPIFDEKDFLSDTREVEFKEIPKKEDKILYKGNYEMKLEEKAKEKFKPSPIISPVYGILEKNYTVDSRGPKEINNFHIDKKDDKDSEIDFDTVRQKAFGSDTSHEKENTIYEIEEDDTPRIDKVTLGDAEEYYDDLGLEYNVDYKINSKKKVDQKLDDEKIVEDSKEKDDPEEKNLYDLIDLMYDGKDE